MTNNDDNMHLNSNAMNAAPRTILNLQAMRAIAALLVALGHALAFTGITLPAYFGGELIHRFAYAGVDIFFVISGFVICSTADRCTANVDSATPSWRVSVSFLVRRFFRIYPLYWILFAIVLALATPLHIDTNAIRLGVSIKSFFLMEKYNPFLAQAWSLVFELYFYVACSICIAIAGKRYGVLLFVWLILSIIGSLWMSYFNPIDSILLDPMLMEFGFGCLIYFVTARQQLSAPWFFLLCGLLFFALGAYQTPHGQLLPSISRTPTFGIGAAFIIYALIVFECRAQLILPKPLVRLGDISYSIYLTHIPLIGIALFLNTKNAMFMQNYPLSFLTLLFGAILVLSTLTYRYIEIPANKFGANIANRLFAKKVSV